MEPHPKATESSKESDADRVCRKFVCAIRRLRYLRSTIQRGSTGLLRTQLSYRLPGGGGGPVGRCHCCTFKNLPRSCQIRRPSKLIVFQALETAPTTSPRESSSLLIEERSSAGSNAHQSKGEDDESSEGLSDCFYSSMSFSRPSEQIQVASTNAQPEEQGALASLKTFVLSLMNQSLRRSIVADLNPIEKRTTLPLRKKEIIDQGTTNPHSQTLAHSRANLISDQGTKKPSESSIDQKGHQITDRAATNCPSESLAYSRGNLITDQGTKKTSETSIDQKGHLITHRVATCPPSKTSIYQKASTDQGSKKPSKNFTCKKANKITAVKPKIAKYLNVFSSKDTTMPSEKCTYRKSDSIVHHDKTKPCEKSGNVEFNTTATQSNSNADIDCSGNCDIFPILKRMHSEVDTLEARLDVLQSEITALQSGSKTLDCDSALRTVLNLPMPTEYNSSMDSVCAEQVEVDDKEFISDIKCLFKKYTQRKHTGYRCSLEKLRGPCYRGTSLCIDPWSHRIKLYESRRKTLRVEDSGKHSPAQQYASICDLCSHKDLPILDDLEWDLKRQIGNRPYTDIMLIILVRGDNVYHISVQVKSSNQVLGCILATHEAIQEAINRECFNEILTFCLVDKCKAPFKFLARVNTKADKTDPCQLDSRAKYFITNVLGRRLPQ